MSPIFDVAFLWLGRLPCASPLARNAYTFGETLRDAIQKFGVLAVTSRMQGFETRTDAAFLTKLCETLTTPGAEIPAGADQELAEALLRRDFDLIKLVTASWFLIQSNPQVQAIMESARKGDTVTLDRHFSDGLLAAFYSTPLMLALLKTTPVPDLNFEILNIYMRARLLQVAVDSSQPTDKVIQIAAALAIQAYLTDYIYPHSDAESRLLNQLEERAVESSQLGAGDLSLSVLGAYAPLTEVLNRLKVTPESVLLPVQELLRVQVNEPKRERELAAGIPTLTPIEDPVSSAVQAQYEEHPYPRWVTAMKNDPVDPAEFFARSCSGVDIDAFGNADAHSVLFAGCGTGKVVAEEGTLWPNAEILALDLSLPSLAYGYRRAEELRLTNVQFARGDLLRLPDLGKSYDYISCGGVLHHMADPEAGLSALVDVCRPGGVIRICLYSELAREPVRYAQSVIGDRTNVSDDQSIKAVRQDLIAKAVITDSPDTRLQEIFSAMDMYTTSMCRDLLFHVHEQDFTIPRLAEAIGQLGLNFCGFVDPGGKKIASYQSFAPNDPHGLDLMSWHRYETKNPRTFAEMYDFMVQKPL